MSDSSLELAASPDQAVVAVEPFTLVILGASGDLTRRKLIPAVYHLFRRGLLAEKFSVIGFARREWSDDKFRRHLRGAWQDESASDDFDSPSWEDFAGRLHYHRSEFADTEGYQSLRHRIDQLAAGADGPGNCLFYLATPPEFFPVIVEQLKQAQLAGNGGDRACWSRIIIEKPFGRDLASAQQLNNQINSVFDEKQIYRIDHYLGKETVQNLLVLRYANIIFEPLWNQKFIDHVQIAVTETLGIEERGSYYEKSGAARDIVQNHLMHLLSLVAMEPPVSLQADAVRDEKVKVLKALRPIRYSCVPDNIIRGQYTAGTVGKREVCGYRQENRVAEDSLTETFVGMKILIDNWRWSGVPFYLRTGKRLPARITEISIHFKPVPQVLFNVNPDAPMQPNMLVLRIQPNEGISLQFQVKTPGSPMNIQPFKMDFGYAAALGYKLPDDYERLLLDAALGDSTLFARNDEVEAAWAFLAPLLEACDRHPESGIAMYPAGSWGPVAADQLMAADHRQWTLIKRPK